MNMGSFLDEYVKIAASSAEAKNPKARVGRRPIRVDNLLKKANAVVGAAAVKKGILPWLLRYKKPLAILGAGGLGVKMLEEGVVEPMEYGYRARAAGANY